MLLSVLRGGRRRAISSAAWVAPGSTVQGDVQLGENVSVWYNTVVRGSVRVGRDTNIQDGSVVVGNTTIGVGCTIGHAARLSSCDIGDYCLVGIGAVVPSEASMEARSQVAAGAILQPGDVVRTGQMFAGNPAKKMRDLTEKEMAFLEESARLYVLNAAEHRRALESSAT